MAMTHDRAKEVAEFGATVSNEMKALLWRVEEFLNHNSALSIDWAGNPKPSYLLEDVNGNLKGLQFTRQQLANTIGSLDFFRKLMRNQSMTGSQGDHLGNLEQLARADV